jgi:hypothetical protein
MTERDTLIEKYRTQYPRLTKRRMKQEIELTAAEREQTFSTWADNELAQNAVDAATVTELQAAKAIIGRLRNNTATNDDRNKAILWLIKQVRNDV